MTREVITSVFSWKIICNLKSFVNNFFPCVFDREGKRNASRLVKKKKDLWTFWRETWDRIEIELVLMSKTKLFEDINTLLAIQKWLQIQGSLRLTII